MKIKAPYLTTLPITDLKITFALSPLWWILGVQFLIFPLVSVLGIAKMIILRNRMQFRFVISKRVAWFLMFIFVFAISIVLNAFENPAQRTFAAVNNLAIFVMGLFVVLIIMNSVTYEDMVDFLKIAIGIVIIGGICISSFLLLWLRGYTHLHYNSLAGDIMPFLNRYPYFAILTNINITDTDWLFKHIAVPRLTLYTAIYTASGGQMLILLPLVVAYFKIKKKMLSLSSLFTLFCGLLILFLSLARTPILAFIASLGLIAFLNSKKRIIKTIAIFILCLPILIVVGSEYFPSYIDIIFNIRPSSTITRFELYKEAIALAMERNPVFGIGMKSRAGFTTIAVGSHSGYIGFFLMTGILGLSFFCLFQASLFKRWFAYMRELNVQGRMISESLGATLLGVATWLLTDSIEAVPQIAFMYFLAIGIYLSLDKMPELTSRESIA